MKGNKSLRQAVTCRYVNSSLSLDLGTRLREARSGNSEQEWRRVYLCLYTMLYICFAIKKTLKQILFMTSMR